MPSIPPLTVALTDGVVELRPISDWDIPEILIAHQDDRHLHHALGQPRAPTGAQLGSEVERAEAEREAGARFSLTLVEPDSDDCRGRVAVTDIDWTAGTAVLSIWVAPDRRGRSLGRRALRLFADWLFVYAGLRQLTLSALPDNTALLTAASAAGFSARPDAPPDERIVLVRAADSAG